MIYDHLLRPLLFRVWSDPEDAHEFVINRLARAGSSPLLLKALRSAGCVDDPALRCTFLGLDFPNPVGLAGGFDKNAVAVAGLEALGFGHIEVGTVTARPQPGNDRPRVFRLPQHEALINRFGFNNQGAEGVAARLAAAPPRRIPLGISLGKSKVTPLEEAVDDYLFSLRTLYPHGDYFAVNVSSPNTPNLRKLQGAEELETLVAALVAERDRLAAAPGGPGTRKPILVKVAPDLEWEALDEALEVCSRQGIDGLVATNTTISRDPLGPNPPAPAAETGGLSGRPLHRRSLEVVRHIRGRLPRMPLIGVGGILSPEDAWAMLRAGADMVQVYTGFIYRGPLFARELNRGLLRIMQREGIRHIRDLRG